MDKILERKKMVVAMEFIARQINDEDVFEGWLMCGVADGDIPYGCLSEYIESLEAYIDDDEFFRDLVSCFLRCMMRAFNSGGLFVGGICCKDRSDYEKERDADEE